MKTCTACRISKPASDFYPHPATRDRLSTYCKPCNTQKHREWRSRNRARVLEYDRSRATEEGRQAYVKKYRLEYERRPDRAALRASRTYGISLDEYEDRFRRNGNRCAICGATETMSQSGRTKRLSLDHDHETGMVRGFLCGRCNSGLGYFRDSEKLLMTAASYLAEWRSERATESDSLAA